MSQNGIRSDNERTSASIDIGLHSRSGGKSTSSPPNTAISPSKSQRMDYSSEADDEDGWGESETDWYADRAMTSPNLVKRRSSHSPSDSETISGHDQTPQPKKKFRLDIAKRGDSPTFMPSEEAMVTPRAMASGSGSSRRKEKGTKTCSSPTSVGSTTSAREEGTSTFAGSRETQNDCDRSSTEMGYDLPADERMQDPRDFYASDSPVFGDSDSDQEWFESAEDFADTLDTEGCGEQVSGSSAGICPGQSWPSQNNEEPHVQPTSPDSQPSQPSLFQPTLPSQAQSSGEIQPQQSPPSQAAEEPHARPTSLHPQPSQPSSSQSTQSFRPPSSGGIQTSQPSQVAEEPHVRPTSLHPQPSRPPPSQPSLPSQPQATSSSLIRNQPEANQQHGTSLDDVSNANNSHQRSNSLSQAPIVGVPQQAAHAQNRRSIISRKRRRTSPQRRTVEAKALAKLVRVELASLLNAAPPYGRIPERYRIAEFEAQWNDTGHGAKACEATTTAFMVDVVGTPKSPWNVSAGRVFTSYLIEKMGYDDVEETRKTIEEAFSTRLKGLKTSYNKRLLSQAEKAAGKSKHSRNQRKYQLYHRRRGVAKQYEPLRRHVAVLDALGVDGMSSDESDIDPTTNQVSYTVIKPDWRHPELQHWLQIFDQLHRRNHLGNWSNDKRGAFAHLRVGSQKVHRKMCAPPNLPINAYNPQWLDARQELYVKHVLCPNPATYDFTHGLDIIGLLTMPL